MRIRQTANDRSTADRRAPEFKIRLFLQIGQHIDPLEDHADLALSEADPGVEVFRRGA